MKDLEKLLSKVLPDKVPDTPDRTLGNEIHELTEGEYIDPDRKVFKKEYTVRADKEVDIPVAGHFDISAVIAKYAGIPLPELEDLLFIDTETTGLAGGTGTYAFQIGLAYFTQDQLKVVQLFLTDMDGELILLQELSKYLGNYTTFVSYNGKSFDIPLLSSRFIINKLPDPTTALNHIDLLHLSRRIWRNSLPDCSLGTVEREILEIYRSNIKDIPGSEIPHEYFFYLQTRDATEMIKVIYHNYFDMISMFFLLKRISEIFSYTDSVEFLEEIFGLARLFAEQQEIDKAIELFEKILLIHPNHKESRKKLSNLYKQRNDIPRAIQLWEKAVENNEIYACIELAKHYEHNVKDLHKALEFTQSALKIAYNTIYDQQGLLDELHHRLNRLNDRSGHEKRN
ncbi:ribonuclease H-like domain-containing protein [Candidatus Cloacimonadota bacterium]